MKGLAPLFLGLFGTFMFSWVGLTVIPNMQIGGLDPQIKDEGADIYPMPQSGMAQRGLQVYNANGCVYCHSRWVRADYAASDIDRKWGERRSAPRDYLFERPVLLGKMRTGPDLSNIGQRAPLEEENAAPAGSASPGASPAAGAAPAPGASPAAAGSSAAPGGSPAVAAAAPKAPTAPASGSPAPAGSPAAAVTPAAAAQQSPRASSLGSENKPNEAPIYSAAWHHRHLYSPRSAILDSVMPAYRFLYDTRPITGQPSADALKLTGADAPPEGWEIVPTYDAKCLVAFLMSSNQSHPLDETKPGGGGGAVPAASPAASPAAAPAK